MAGSMWNASQATASTLRLSDVAHGRDNNFNLIRMVAALAVLVSHSFPIALGRGASEPSLGIVSVSTVAVDVFFVTSGFLVTASLFTRQSSAEFVLARVLRIFPALWLMLLVTVFALGLALTTTTASEYVSSATTYQYLAKCGTLLAGVSFTLPGLFHDNPYPDAVNGSLWTLPYELRMYMILVVVWALFAGFKKGRLRGIQWAVVSMAVLALGALLVSQSVRPADSSAFLRLFYMFFAGSAHYVLRAHIVLRPGYFCALGALLLATTFFARAQSYAVYVAGLPYLLFWLAYVPRGALRRFNRLGDYSYGTYIYAFPVQQTVAALFPGISVLGLGLSAGAVTLLLAAFSWHLVEKPALALKSRPARRPGGIFPAQLEGGHP